MAKITEKDLKAWVAQRAHPKGKSASLVNVTLALAGCFLLLQRLGGCKFELERHVHHDGGLVEFWFPGVSMTIRVPAEWPPITSFG